MVSLPDPVLNELRCYKCKNFLSCIPISITDKGGSLCGRCKPDQPVMQAHAYECVADYFLFPCKNWEKHCAYLLNIKDVMEHEDSCSYGNCCFSPGSLWKTDNSLDLTQNLKFYNIPDEEVLSVLTCTLCGFHLSSCPIHVNADGHSICHRCYTSKDGKISLNYVRHYALETIVQILLFPCIYRNRGCTKVFRFGYNSDHEQMCSYNRTQKPFSTFTDPSNGKQKGVIQTHTGHMFGTIRPYSQFFVAQSKVPTENNYGGVEPIKVVPNEKQERFFNQLLKHRDSLQYQWNRNYKIDGSNSPPKIVNDISRTVPDEIDEKSEILSDRPSFRSDENFILERPTFRTDTQPDLKRQSSYPNEPLSPLPKEELIQDEAPGIRLSPLEDNFNEMDSGKPNKGGYASPNRPHRSTSSGSDIPNIRGSPQSSICSQPTGSRSPLKLNPADLMYSNSLNYSERSDRAQLPERDESFSSNRDNNRNYSPQVHQNSLFRY
ncbi:hypothetical protein AMK59_2500 [Oryctes borbonicus]|uniref:E3 ubiquitin-protein ligase n=1 Tax=Oryctes borbonicus TaxID=1629725 RepID=A0A0T6B9Z2_9SCAR|nr:hypothetical protein AMK59_2500 [Oryctes borbonicus]